MKTLASAQHDFRANDRDGDGRQNFWRKDVAGLYSIKPPQSDDPIALIELSIAAADDRGGMEIAQYAELGQKAGYFYRALRFSDEVEGALDENRYAACAFP